MLAILCPGQGAQQPGMLSPWLEDPHTSRLLREWSDLIGLDLIELGTNADAQSIQDTAVAQPLITAATLVSFAALMEQAPGDTKISLAAGHSVGEIGASVVAGVLSNEDALRLVHRRGEAMARAAATASTGMSAVVGGTAQEVLEAIKAVGATAANINGGGQVVAAGTQEQLDQLAANAPARARVIPLSVAGAFHTTHMAPAVAEVEGIVETLSPHNAQTTLLSNKDGQAISTGTEVLERIVGQIANPVRWDLCSETMSQLGVTAAIELCPGGVLTGLAKRTLKGVQTLALKSPNDLPAAWELMATHGGNQQ